ncbi:MAG: DUF1211 domain-containing protein [Chitinophagaceae bacterium]|nr:DUF1211 domain-containing protein [Chitinophagaceae bacterium]
MHEEKEMIRTEIKKEFQLERMILFSDAVFAIVITLMAIEIRLPETEHRFKGAELLHHLKLLIPVIFAYLISFGFIGTVWYQHLKIFGLLKDYDKGLILRNLLLLFFVALFPFCVSVVIKSKPDILAYSIYFGAIFICVTIQFALHHYVLIGNPSLRVNTNLSEHMSELEKKKRGLISLLFVIGLIAITYIIIPDESNKPLATLWLLPLAIISRIYERRLKMKKNDAL